MKIVTAGNLYADIDVYAGITAYAELLRAQGHDAAAVTTAPTNASVPQLVQDWHPALERRYTPAAEDSYILIDISNPEHFETFVALDRVEAVLDHHVGFEQYWQERLGHKARIEFIGAACTLVYEAWRDAGLLDQMSKTSAKLLVCGILDNTLNFSAQVTSPRDHAAYADLLGRGQLDETWPTAYFSACEEAIQHDAIGAIQDDSKVLNLKTINQPILAGQVAVWDGKALLSEWQEKLITSLHQGQSEWFVNLISIGEKKSYFVATSPVVQRWLGQLLGISFDGPVAVAPHVWLRKEIIKQDHTSP